MQIVALEDRLMALDPQFQRPTTKMENPERLDRLQKRLDELRPNAIPDPARETRTLLARIDIARVALMGLEHYQEYRRREIRNWALGIGATLLILAGITLAFRRRKERRTAQAPASTQASVMPVASAEPAPPASPESPSMPAASPGAAAGPVVSDSSPAPPAPVVAPAKQGRKLFISFSTSDLDFVESTLAPALRQAGHEPWFSAVSIRPSDLWERSILSGLEACEWVLIVMSPHAVSSKWVQLETHWATEHREGRIVPLMIVRCDPWKLHMKLGNLQYVDFERSPDAMADLLDIIETRSCRPKA